MLRHRLTPTQIVGNLILVKNSLELKLVGFHISQKQANILITRPIMNPLSDGLSHILQLFFLVHSSPNLKMRAVCLTNFNSWF